MPVSRFDYVKYDEQAIADQAAFKEDVTFLENRINAIGNSGSSARSRSLALTKLEECYMWIGKAIRDEQVLRSENTELQEERVNS